MFSARQKQELAQVIEDKINEFNHPEMPAEKPHFKLEVAGNSAMSWANIMPNWKFTKENPPTTSDYNERVESK